jgi:PiT family inorganic phosphate transporter
VLRFVVRNPALYTAPKGDAPPPWWIRGVLILTCTGVSFAHGSNDGQKGMGLIILILIGVVPTAYALNRTPAPDYVQEFQARSAAAAEVIEIKTSKRRSAAIRARWSPRRSHCTRSTTTRFLPSER